MTLSTLSELQAQYAALSARIAALDRDIALETDRERLTVAQEKRDELAAKREKVAADITLHGGTPTDAHLEVRVGALERDVSWIKSIIKPGVRQTASRVIFYGMFVAILVLWVKPETFTWMMAHPFQALLITLALGIAALIIRWLPEAEDHDQR